MKSMITKNNEIIHDMHNEDLMQVDNLDKIRFDVGFAREEYEGFRGTEVGIPHYYIKSAGIYFPISGGSANTILAKIERLNEIKKNIEEANIGNREKPRREEKEAEKMKSKEYRNIKSTEWVFHKIDVHRGCVAIIPNDAICITYTTVGGYDYVSWLDPHER